MLLVLPLVVECICCVCYLFLRFFQLLFVAFECVFAFAWLVLGLGMSLAISLQSASILSKKIYSSAALIIPGINFHYSKCITIYEQRCPLANRPKRAGFRTFLSITQWFWLQKEIGLLSFILTRRGGSFGVHASPWGSHKSWNCWN